MHCSRSSRGWRQVLGRAANRSIFHFQSQKGSARKRLPSIVSERFASRSNARLRIVSHLRMPSRLRELLVSRGLYLRRPRAMLGDRRQLVYWNFSRAALVVAARPCPRSRSAFPRSRGKATLITTVKFLDDESPFQRAVRCASKSLRCLPR